MNKLENKVAAVTGATGALGRVVTKTLLEKGAKTVVLYRSDAKLTELLEFVVKDFQDQVTAIKEDVNDAGNVRDFVQETVDKHGRVDFLLNIAGAWAGGKDVANTDEQTWDFIMNVNLKSVFLCCKAVLPFMIKQNYGRIVSVASRAAVEKRWRAKSATYAVSKVGVVILTEAIAEEVKDYNINVNCILPSVIDTPANRRSIPKADFSKGVDPKDIAEVIAFLLSDASEIISGAAVPIYGKA
jgi:NAD(P)-dependent dehydrogenase (short-subunit alcohol dehydrogenase family)